MSTRNIKAPPSAGTMGTMRAGLADYAWVMENGSREQRRRATKAIRKTTPKRSAIDAEGAKP